MNTSLLLDMARDGNPSRAAVTDPAGTVDYQRLSLLARRGAALIERLGVEHVVLLAQSGLALPVALFAAGYAGRPFLPLNYRLGDDQIGALLARHEPALVIVEAGAEARVEGVSDASTVLTTAELLDQTTSPPEAGEAVPVDAESAALILYTSGTTAAPKAAVLRHRHLISYVFGSGEFGSAAAGDAALVCVPPYHIAGVSNLLTNVFAGRRIVYMPSFDAESWLVTVRAESITNALVVPTMLAQVVESLDSVDGAATPSLKSLAYGGAPMPMSVLERALDLFPETDFVNAYGLTETSSTIVVLDPDDHRLALGSEDPSVRARLGSVGRPIPGVELEIRLDGRVGEAGETGDVWVRGPQIAGEYLQGGPAVDREGWFPTRDRGRLDTGGYLFIDGRADDTIIRGGENVAPAEIEDQLLRHRAVVEAAVTGLTDTVWGERIGAAVVLREGVEVDEEALRDWVRRRLRGSKTPDVIEQWKSLPRTDTGKLRRRLVAQRLEESR